MTWAHGNLVTKVIQQYTSDWIVLRELSFKGYRFDVFAFNPKTKEVEITEVEISKTVDEQKLKFAATLGKVKTITNTKKHDVTVQGFQAYLHALDNPHRIAILERLFDFGKQSYGDLAHSLNFAANSGGAFGYHIKRLAEEGLIDKSNGHYSCSQKGRKFLTFFRSIDKLKEKVKKK